NEAVQRSSGFVHIGSAALWGVVIRDSNVVSASGPANAIINIDIASDVVIQGNRLRSTASYQNGVKVNAANPKQFNNIRILNNDIDVPFRNVWLVGKNAVP